MVSSRAGPLDGHKWASLRRTVLEKMTQRIDVRRGDILHSQADIRKAQKRMGYTPAVTFQEGLRRTVEWYRDNI